MLLSFSLLMIVGLVVVEWRTAAVRSVCHFAVTRGQHLAVRVTDPYGAFVPLPRQLPYRDFYRDDVVETENGMFWVGLELTVPATDGLSNGELNSLGIALARCLSTLPEGTHVQAIQRKVMSNEAAIQALEKAREQAAPEFAAVYADKLAFFRKEELQGRLHCWRHWVFLGIQAPKKGIVRRLGLRGLWSSAPWIDLEVSEYQIVRDKLNTLAATFAASFAQAGGRSQRLGWSAIFSLAYERLNPARACMHPAPRYAQDLNPREVLCLTNVDVKDGVLCFENVASATLSLHRLPVQVSPKSLEYFFRSSTLNFPLEVNAHFKLEKWASFDAKLDRVEKDLHRAMNQQSLPDPDEALKAGEIAEIRQLLREGEEAIGQFGFAISLAAPNEAELQRRIEVILNEAHKVEGLELVMERTSPVRQHLATLPCGAGNDVRTKPLLSKHAALLFGWSGAPLGLTEEEGMVFQHVDGGVVQHHQTASFYNVNHALVCGQTGTGKSALMNQLRFDHLAQGRRGVLIDYRASGHRLVELAGGVVIDICNPAAAPFLAGLFDIWPREDETFSADQLSLEGLPLDRLFEVTELLARLTGQVLHQKQRKYLSEAVRRTYDNAMGEIPTMDDFLRTLDNALSEDEEVSRFLVDRLSIYHSHEALGRYFNERGRAFDFSALPLVCFDFASAKGKENLLFVGNLAATMLIERMLFSAKGRSTGTFLQVDEFAMLAQSPLLASTLDDLVRTARKFNAHITLASQRVEDFTALENIRNIASDCAVRYLFHMPAEEAMALNLSVGQANMVERLTSGGPDYRDCVLITPSISAKLRLRYSPIETRLFMEAATQSEKCSASAALAYLSDEIPPRLKSAILLEPRAEAAKARAASV